MYKVSVIILIYNTEKYLKRCLDSLFKQTLENIQFIFVNDCTPDNSLSIIKETMDKYPEKKANVNIISHKKNRGSAAARNTGFSLAEGEYIIYFDSDDWIEIDMYEKMYNAARKNQADIVICDYFTEYPKSNIYCSQQLSGKKEYFLEQILRGKLHNGLWNKLIKKDLYENLSFLWTENINMWEDVSIIPRLFYYANKIITIPEALYHYSQINDNSYTHTLNEKSLNNILEATNILEKFFSDKEDIYQKDINYLKLRAKQILLHSCLPDQRVKYKQIYPESDKYLFKHPGLSFISKIELWFRIHSMNTAANIVVRFTNKIKKIIR